MPDILLCTENITVNLIILGLIEFFYFITYWSFKKKKKTTVLINIYYGLPWELRR